MFEPDPRAIQGSLRSNNFGWIIYRICLFEDIKISVWMDFESPP